TGVCTELAHDRHQGLAELLELLPRLPHVEHLDLPVDLHGAVERPAGHVAEAGARFFELADSLVVVGRGKSGRLEVQGECHIEALWGRENHGIQPPGADRNTLWLKRKASVRRLIGLRRKISGAGESGRRAGSRARAWVRPAPATVAVVTSNQSEKDL